jgi:hypothetical protein
MTAWGQRVVSWARRLPGFGMDTTQTRALAIAEAVAEIENVQDAIAKAEDRLRDARRTLERANKLHAAAQRRSPRLVKPLAEAVPITGK